MNASFSNSPSQRISHKGKSCEAKAATPPQLDAAMLQQIADVRTKVHGLVDLAITPTTSRIKRRKLEFFDEFVDEVRMSQFDVELITQLYHPNISIGISRAEYVEKILKDLWK